MIGGDLPTHTNELDVFTSFSEIHSVMQRGLPPTQKLIASRLGVSQALVSRALSGRGAEIGASPETIERIRRTAVELNYQPSATALALLGAPTRTIGVVVKNFDDPYFGHLIGELQVLARENGYSLLLTGGNEQDLAALQKHRVDGVILAGSDFFPNGVLNLVHQSKMPVVQIGLGPVSAATLQISMDGETGIAGLVDYLSGLGHSNFGFVAQAAGANLRRGDFLRKALRSHKLPVHPHHFYSFEGDGPEVAGQAVEALLQQSKRPTVLLAAEDSIAIPLLRKLYEAGLRVPQDISVTGVDDIPGAAQTIPPLTTLRQPMAQMASAAFGALTGSEMAGPPIFSQGEIVLRGSCSVVV